MVNWFFNKRGQAEWELTHIIFALIFLVLLASIVTILFFGKGGAILDAIRNALRFGR